MLHMLFPQPWPGTDHLGLSSLHAGVQLPPAPSHSFCASCFPCPHPFQLSPPTEHSEGCQSLRAVWESKWDAGPSGAPSTNNPWLCQTGHWGEANEPLLTHDLHCHWFHGLCILQVKVGNVTMTTAPGAAGMQNTYFKKVHFPIWQMDFISLF